MKNIILIFLIVATVLSCSTHKNGVDQNYISNYMGKMGIPQNLQYRIADSLQKQALDRGQPNLNVYDYKNRQLKAGTCYMEMPFFIDTLFSYKHQVSDTMSLYYSNPEPISKKISELVGLYGNQFQIDTTKKYTVFYHYAMYAKDFDQKIIPAMYERYKDSVQFIFINTDNWKKS